MISKERLEELIEQGATIYTTYGGYVSEISLHKKYDYTTDNYLFEADMVAGEVGYRKYPFNMLFETLEDAEWHKEFGCIERTERLELPTWEEVSKDFIPLKVDSGLETVVEFGDNSIEIIVNIDKSIQIVLWSDFVGKFVAPLTKENYTLACRKAKELFLGE